VRKIIFWSLSIVILVAIVFLCLYGLKPQIELPIAPESTIEIMLMKEFTKIREDINIEVEGVKFRYENKSLWKKEDFLEMLLLKFSLNPVNRAIL